MGRAEPGPVVTADSVRFRFPDRGERGEPTLAGVRLLPALSLPDTSLDWEYAAGQWSLLLARPPVWRMEYRLQLRYPDGGVEEICDPDNPRRAPGAFGDKSVVEFPDYRPPDWLDAPSPGSYTELTVPSRFLGSKITARLWAPEAEPAEPLPLLVAHDGPEYDRLAGLTGYCAALTSTGRLPRHRVALLAPGDRNDEYSANPTYSLALAREVLPALREVVSVRGPVVGMGASLGGLAMLHAHRRHPRLFGGLFLQSGSFFDRGLDAQEQRFSRFRQVTRFIADTIRAAGSARRIPVAVTCGTAEENLANNRKLTAALRAQHYPVTLIEVPDAHNFVAWRDAFDPALTELLRTVWEG